MDASRGLTGFCDYIPSRSRVQLTMNAPVVIIVEAKNENLKGGLGQCLAGTVASMDLRDYHLSSDIDNILGILWQGTDLPIGCTVMVEEA